MDFNSFILYFVLGIAPSVIWLFFYLKKDSHPEPKRKILEVFFSGALAAVIAAVIETIALKAFNIQNSAEVYRAAYLFIAVAITEECLKYLAAEQIAFRNSEFDEPTDAVIYLIVSGLGFGALENVFLFFSEGLSFSDTLLVATMRFIGATLLHALASGILGYFIAVSFCQSKNRAKLFAAGLLSAVLLHGIYNFFIMKADQAHKLLIPGFIILVAALFLSSRFNKLKKMKSICETKISV